MRLGIMVIRQADCRDSVCLNPISIAHFYSTSLDVVGPHPHLPAQLLRMHRQAFPRQLILCLALETVS